METSSYDFYYCIEYSEKKLYTFKCDCETSNSLLFTEIRVTQDSLKLRVRPKDKQSNGVADDPSSNAFERVQARAMFATFLLQGRKYLQKK